VTVVAALSVTVHVPVPVQPPPLQPLNVDPAAGAAVKVTAVPPANAAEHVAPQEMPAGLLVTVPLPVPVFEIVSAKVDVRVTVKLSVAMFPAASRAVTVSTFTPTWRAIPLTVQLVVRVGLLVLKVGLAVGVVMVTPGAVASVPLPDTTREIVSPSAAKVTFAVAVAVDVGLKRTVTVLVAFSPVTLNGLPETILKGAGTDAVPDTVPPAVFCTVRV